MKRILITLAGALALGVFSPAVASATVAGVQAGQATGALAHIAYAPSTTFVNLGPVAPAAAGCSFAPSLVGQNSVLTAALPANGSLAKSATVQDTVTLTRTATVASVQSVSYVQSLNVLNGMIKASVAKGVVTVSSAAPGSASFAGSQFIGLVINGVPIAVSVPANTKVALPGIGFVVLNEQVTSVTGIHSITMIDVRVTMANSFNLAVGSSITAAHAQGSFTGTAAPSLVGAASYSLFARGFGNLLSATSGPWAPDTIGCIGGNTAISLAFANTPVGSLGVQYDRAAGGIGSTLQFGTAQANVATVNLLGGLIKASAIQSTAYAAWNSGMPKQSASVVLTSAFINGTPLVMSPSPGARVNIPGLGYAILNEQVRSVTASSVIVAVNAIDLYVTIAPNSKNLALGARIIVGHAAANAQRF